jgi:PAS domain S-box-containing protein
LNKFDLDINLDNTNLKDDNNFESFFNSFREPIIIFNLDGKIMNANIAFYNLTEYSISELKNFSLFNIHPKEYKLEIENVIQDIILSKKEKYYLPLLKKSGEYTNVEINITFGEWNGINCVYGMLKNISSEKKLNLNLKKIFDFSSMMISIIRIKDKKVIDVNETLLKNLGYKRDEIIGKTVMATQVFEEVDKFIGLFTKLLKNNFIEERFELIKKDGSILNGIFRSVIIDNYKEQAILSAGFTEEKLKEYIELIPTLNRDEIKKDEPDDAKEIYFSEKEYKINELNILVLDINKKIEDIITTLSETYNVTTINNAYKVISSIISTSEKYGIIFITDRIDGMTAFEFNNAISSIPNFKDSKKIYIGNNDEYKQSFKYALKGDFTDEDIKSILSKFIVKDKRDFKKNTSINNSQLSVLVVDDNEVNRKIMSKLLKQTDVKLELAVNGKDAFEKTKNYYYDIIFMDCQMPVMDGYESTKKIRKYDGINKDTKIIAMTAYAMEGDKEKCITSGMDDYMSKPINLEKIIEFINRIKENK